jgi:UDP-N-acetylglucosamine:LPS N-acetylglucosamine transferase
VKDGDMVENPNLLLEAIRTLVRSPKKREELSEKLHTESKTDAATRLADILIENA